MRSRNPVKRGLAEVPVQSGAAFVGTYGEIGLVHVNGQESPLEIKRRPVESSMTRAAFLGFVTEHGDA
jgi:hypothetical protein